MMAGAGVMAAGGGGTTWDLTSMGTSYVDLGSTTTTYGVQVIFRTDGTLDVTRTIGANLNDEVNPYVSPTSQTTNTWVQCSYNSGNHLTGGSSEESWNRLSSQVSFLMEHTTSGGSDEIQGFFDFNLSSDASGSPIEATKSNVSLNVGEIF